MRNTKEIFEKEDYAYLVEFLESETGQKLISLFKDMKETYTHELLTTHDYGMMQFYKGIIRGIEVFLTQLSPDFLKLRLEQLSTEENSPKGEPSKPRRFPWEIWKRK